MKHPVASTLAVLLLLPGCKKKEETFGAENLVIARVNRTDVRRSNFQSYLRYAVYLPEAARSDEAGGDAHRSELTDEVNSRLLDAFLVEQVLLERARHGGIKVTREEVDAFSQAAGLGALADMQAELPITQREFLERYLEESSLIKRLVDGEALGSIHATDEEIRAYYDANNSEFAVPRRFRFRLIHVDSMGEAQELADRIARNPMKFTEEAKDLTSHDDQDQEQGRDLGLWNAAALPESFTTALSALPDGGVTDLVEDPDGGYNILHLIESRAAMMQPIEQVHQQIERQLLSAKRLQASQSFIDGVRAASTIEIIPENLGFAYVAPPEPRQQSSGDANGSKSQSAGGPT